MTAGSDRLAKRIRRLPDARGLGIDHETAIVRLSCRMRGHQASAEEYVAPYDYIHA